jgi:hypothetical protein
MITNVKSHEASATVVAQAITIAGVIVGLSSAGPKINSVVKAIIDIITFVDPVMSSRDGSSRVSGVRTLCGGALRRMFPKYNAKGIVIKTRAVVTSWQE